MAALHWSAGRAGLVLQCAKGAVTAAPLWHGSAGKGGIVLLQVVCGTCTDAVHFPGSAKPDTSLKI